MFVPQEVDAFLEDYFCKTVLKIKERSGTVQCVSSKLGCDVHAL